MTRRTQTLLSVIGGIPMGIGIFAVWPLAKKFGKRNVTMWGFVEKKEISTLILPQSRILGLDDYNLFGKPRDYVLNDLQSEHYDLLLDLTTHPMLPLRYLAMFTDADFKVGLNLGEGVHDMLISLPALSPEQEEVVTVEASWLFDQIMRYLTTIRSND